MKKQNNKSQITAAAWLKEYAIYLYLPSLFMVALNKTIGLGTMFLGLVMIHFYVAGGLAVYANFCFWALAGNKNSKVIANFMMFFALQTFIYLAIFLSEPRETVGLGVFFWLLAITLMYVSVMMNPEIKISKSFKIKTHASVWSILLPAICLAIYNYQRANLQERKEFFPITSVYTTGKFSGVKYSPPPKEFKIKPSEIIKVNKDTKEEFPFPMPLNYVKDGYFHQDYMGYYGNDPSFKVSLLSENKSPKYVYTIKQTGTHSALITLKNLDNNTTIYSQPVSKVEYVSGARYKPDYKRDIKRFISQFYRGKDNHSPSENIKIKESSLKFQKLEKCPAKVLNISVKSSVQWNSKQIAFHSNEDLAIAQWMCTEDFAIKLNIVPQHFNKNTKIQYRLVAIFFDRRNMLPLFYYHTYYDKEKYLTNKFKSSKFNLVHKSTSGSITSKYDFTLKTPTENVTLNMGKEYWGGNLAETKKNIIPNIVAVAPAKND